MGQVILWFVHPSRDNSINEILGDHDSLWGHLSKFVCLKIWSKRLERRDGTKINLNKQRLKIVSQVNDSAVRQYRSIPFDDETFHVTLVDAVISIATLQWWQHTEQHPICSPRVSPNYVNNILGAPDKNDHVVDRICSIFS